MEERAKKPYAAQNEQEDLSIFWVEELLVIFVQLLILKLKQWKGQKIICLLKELELEWWLEKTDAYKYVMTELILLSMDFSILSDNVLIW